MTQSNTPESQEVRRQFYTLITAQIVFVANGEIQMITRSHFGFSPSPNYTAHYLLQLQNALAFQVRNHVESQGVKFEKTLDVVILSLVPLGQMTQEEFWEGMGSTQEAETVPMAEAPPVEQSIEGADTTNLVQLTPAAPTITH
jgi:hypothetical protein